MADIWTVKIKWPGEPWRWDKVSGKRRTFPNRAAILNWLRMVPLPRDPDIVKIYKNGKPETL